MADLKADADAPLKEFASRMIRAGYSYDATEGVWWKADSKPPIVQTLEARVQELEDAARLAQAYHKACEEARVKAEARVAELEAELSRLTEEAAVCFQAVNDTVILRERVQELERDLESKEHLRAVHTFVLKRVEELEREVAELKREPLNAVAHPCGAMSDGEE